MLKNNTNIVRIGVLSDTHGNIELARLAVKKMGQLDFLLHAGDHYSDAKRLGGKKKFPVYAVVGNCDWGMLEPEDILVNVNDKRIWVTHGHRYGVKRGYQMLLEQAQEHQIDVVIYGHTHMAISEVVDGILFFNPGSLTYPRGNKGPTYGIIEIEGDKITPYIFEL